jgi:hypothetical protein
MSKSQMKTMLFTLFDIEFIVHFEFIPLCHTVYQAYYVQVLKRLREAVRAMIAQSVQRWATSWTIGVLGFDSRRGLGIFLYTTASRTVLVPAQPPMEWVLGALSLGLKRPGREADYSPPSSAEVKNAWSYTSTPNTSSWRGAYLSTGTNLPLPIRERIV